MVTLFFIGEIVGVFKDQCQYCRINSVCFSFVLGLMAAPLCEGGEMHLLRVPDYDNFSFDEVMIDQNGFYVPNGGDQIGYTAFPSTPYRQRLDKIELRGDTLGEGFRMKEEYRDGFISTYGVVYDSNMFAF